MIRLSINKRLQAASGPMPLVIDLDIKKNNLVSLYGKSGSGKTTLLRILSGLTPPDSGQIIVNDMLWLDTKKGIDIPPQKRKVGFLFQDYALFPNMTVKENLSFALEKGQDQKIISELLEIIELGDLQHQKPTLLSGGQQQRVALARALVQRPELLLLDEPLAALDQEIRIKLQDYILKVHREYGLTTILVSHDISEILKTSNAMIVLDHGKIIQQGSPMTIFGPEKIEGKIQFTGEILELEQQDSVVIMTLLIGKHIIKITTTTKETKTVSIGDTILVSSDTFDPVFKKIHKSD